MPDLVVDGLTKSFATLAKPLHVLQGVSLSLSAAESLAVVGPSGCGKSTLLHILGTLDRPTSGSVRLNAIDPFALTEPELADFRNARIGFVFQDHHLLPQCTARENVLIPTLARGAARQADFARADELLQRVGLGERGAHRPAELSGGERQRAAIARALLLRPRLLLADEPTGNLDRSTATSIVELLVELLQNEPVMLVVVTHSLEVAARMQHRVELDAGRLVDLP